MSSSLKRGLETREIRGLTPVLGADDTEEGFLDSVGGTDKGTGEDLEAVGAFLHSFRFRLVPN